MNKVVKVLVAGSIVSLIASQFGGAAEAQIPDRNQGSVATQNGDKAQDSVAVDTAKVAIERAKRQLAGELNVDATKIEVVSSEPRTWRDSSLGCGKPGTQSLQVITQGFVVTLKVNEATYQVHTAKNQAVVCRSVNMRNPRSVGLPLKDLKGKIDIARADLSKSLGVPENQIRTQNFLATDWPDSSMDCPIQGEQIVQKLTRGYRIGLRYQGRVYTYHTDLDRVRACPAIEKE